MRYKNEKHQSEFEDAIRKKDKKDYAMMAALYLLTADLRLWHLSKRHVGKISINFADIRLKNIHENGYALFCCAKDGKVEYLYLPCERAAIDKSIGRLGAPDAESVSIILDDFMVDNPKWMRRLREMTSSESIYDINDLVGAI